MEKTIGVQPALRAGVDAERRVPRSSSGLRAFGPSRLRAFVIATGAYQNVCC
jgi:hypothetical protein